MPSWAHLDKVGMEAEAAGLPEATARHERGLEVVARKPLFGVGYVLGFTLLRALPSPRYPSFCLSHVCWQ